MAQVTIGAGGSAVTLYTSASTNAVNVQGPMGQAASCSFDIIDSAGQYHFYKGQPVKVTSSLDSTDVWFQGFIDQRKETKYGFSPGRLHTISCIDNSYLAQKRVIGAAYTNLLCGDIVSDIVNATIAAEGIIGGHAIQTNTNVGDFASGTIINTGAYSDGTDGHLEILHGGSTVSRTESSQSDWGSGTLTGGMTNATAGHLTLATEQVIKVTATSTSTTGFWYLPIGGTVSQSIATGDTLQYDVFVPATSIVCRGGVDCASNNGTHANFRDFHVLDQDGYDSHPQQVLTDHANGVWYHRTISLSNLNGNTVTQWSVAQDNISSAGSLIVYFKDIYVKNSSGVVKYTIFDNTTVSESFGTASTSNVNSVTGIQSTGCVPGTRTSPSLSINNAKTIQSSSISWVIAAQPTNTTIVIQTSIDGGITWQTATSGSPIPMLPAGKNATGLSLLVEQLFDVGGDPGNGTPDITSLSVSVQTASQVVKTDWVKTHSLATDFSAGTLTNLSAANADLTFAGYINTSWLLGTTDSQTQWTSGTSPSTTIQNGTCVLKVTGSGDIKSQLGSASNQTNFIAQYTLTIPSSGDAGFIYRTTAWSNQKDGYAYYFGMSATGWLFGHGTNSTGSSAFTSLQTGTGTFTAGTSHTVVVTVNGSSHTFTIDGTAHGPFTDSTYTGAGGFALRYNNSSASAVSMAFNQVGIAYATSLTGTWTSAGVSLPPYQANSSLIDWDVSAPAGTTVTMDISLDGGTTWTTNITNTAAIPGISAGTSLSGKTVKWRLNFTISNVTQVPVVTGVHTQITTTYYAGGIREHPGLALDVAGIAGSAPIVYTTTLPGGTAIRVDSSLSASDPGTSLGGWITSGTASIDGTVGNGDSSSYALGPASYIYKQQAVNDGQTLDVDVYLDASSVDKYLDVYFKCNAAGAGQAFRFNANAVGQSGFVTTTAWNTTGSVSTSALFTSISLATWYRVTLVFAAAQVTAYINGQLAAVAYTYSATGNYIALASQAATSGDSCHFDNLAVWNTQPGTAQNIPGINFADGNYIDSFEADSSPQFLTAHPAGGVDAAWTWDIANSRLDASGGSSSILLYNTALQSPDVTLVIDIDTADAGGLVARYSDTNDFYELVLSDGSSTNAASTAVVYKHVGGVVTQIAASQNLGWARGDLVRFTWTVQGTNQSLVFAGNTVLSFTDSAITSGSYVGFWNDTVASGSSAQFYTLSIQPIGQTTTGMVAYTREHLTSTDPTVTPQLLSITTSCRSWYIQDGPTILSAVFSYPTVYDAISTLATQANFMMTIDKNKRLYFMPRTAMLAPWIANGLTMILESIEIDHGNPLYRNTQYIRGVTDQTDPQVMQQHGDGLTQAFTLGYPLASVPTVKVNTVVQTIGIKGVDTGKQWYWSQGSEVITQDSAGTPLSSSDLLEVDYIGQFDAIIISNDTTLITDRQNIEGGGTGIVENVVDEPNDTSAAIAQQSASNLVSTYGVIGQTVKFQTRKAGLQVGQLLTVNLPEHDIHYQDFLIEQADPFEGPGGQTYYNVSAIEGPITGDWAAVFKRMSAQTPVVVDQVNLGTNQVLTTSLPISESTPWVETVTPVVNTGVAPDTTLYPSTSIYPI